MVDGSKVKKSSVGIPVTYSALNPTVEQFAVTFSVGKQLRVQEDGSSR